MAARVLWSAAIHRRFSGVLAGCVRGKCALNNRIAAFHGCFESGDESPHSKDLLALGLTVLAIFLAIGARAFAAADDAPVQPWLRINAGGHTAAVHALAYTPDGKRLCSAGLDKAVQVWNLTAVARDLRRAFLRERTIRWQVARGLRGSIYVIVSSPGDGLLAFGGYGAMGSLGEILLVHPVEGNLVKVLQGHRQTVCALAFSADGNWLASSDVGGQIVLWRRGQWQPRTLYDPDGKTYDAELAKFIQQQPKLRPIAIAGNQEVIVPACIGRQADGRLAWRLQQIGLENPNAFRTLDATHQGMVTALAATRDGAWLASADLAGKLFLWDLKADAAPVELDSKGVVLSLSFSRDGRTLAVGTAVDPARKTSQLQVWDVAARSLKRSQTLPDQVHACAISPDNKDVAYVGGPENEVFVEAIERPEQRIALCGSGRRILKVAFARDDPPYRVAFGAHVRERGFNDYAELDESFDPMRLELGAPGTVKPADWLPADWGHGNWSIQYQADGGLQTYRDQNPQGRIALDPVFEGCPRSYCWIPDVKGETFAIAVGTDVQNSVYVYRLVADGRCPVLRHFRGHHDYVTSVAVSRDLRYLVSASADGTIAFWSLAQLEQAAELPGRWGAALATQGDQLLATEVHPAGPLWGKGMRKGDELRQIRWNDGQADHSEVRPAEICRQLETLPWGTQVVFDYVRQGAGQPSFQLLPAWQPLATLFISAERQWAFWTPQGYYDASINGYTLFGWQVNRGLEALPDFYRADQFRKKLERPDVMEHLLPAGSLEGAFEAARLKPPVQAQRILPDQIAATPQVEILSPRAGQLVPGGATALRARIVVPAGGNLLQAQVFANGVVAVGQRLVERRNLPTGSELTYDWDVRLPADPKNLIQLIVGTDAPTAARSEILIERPAGVRPDRAPHLRILAVGIDTYRDPAIQRLSFAVADADAMAQTLQERSKGWYTVDRCALLKNEQSTPEQWQKSLDELCGDLRERARPDDLLVLFFAGHGFVDRQTRQYYFVGHDFTLEDLDKKQYARCISLKDFRLLAGIPCRKLVLLDTCHAGAIQTPRSQDLKAGVRELQDHVIFTFAASTSEERSAENKAWKHGAFTQAVLESLRGEEPGPPTPVITFNEVVGYVQAAVRKLTKGRQNPTAAPDEVLPFTSLILAERERSTNDAAPVTRRVTMKHVYHEGDEPVPGAGYRLVCFLGRGGFGEVWKATTPGGAEAAVKIIRLDGVEGRKEFRALQLVKRVRHPNLMPLVAFWLKGADGEVLDDANVVQTELRSPEGSPSELQGTMMAEAVFPPTPAELIIVMGLGDKSLYDRLEECRAQGLEGIPIEETLGYMEDTAEAIDYLNSPVHDHGSGPMAIQHCDIKPHNLMIVGGAVQVCDFGLARMMGVDRITTGAASIAYAAPELLDNNNISASTDQYSLAITYYELRSGRLPYQGDAISAVLDAKHQDKYDFSGCSCEEQKVLRRAASLDPEKRYPSALNMVKALRQAVTAEENLEAAGSPGKSRRLRRTWAAVLKTLALLSVLGALAVGAWLQFRPAPLPPEPVRPVDVGHAPAPMTTAIVAAKAAPTTSPAAAVPTISTDALLEHGTQSLEKKDYDSAIADFTQAALQAPRNFRPFSRRGTAWLRKAEHEKAVADFTTALDIEPAATDYVNRGRSYRAMDQLPQAITDFNAAIKLDPAGAAAFCFRGECYLKLERYNEAISDFTEAILRSSQRPDLALNLADAYTFRGSAYLLQGHAAEAIKDFTEALRLEPRDPVSLHNSRADAYELAERPALAKSDSQIAELLKKIGDKPDDAAAYRELALVFATHPGADLRDGKKAVELATQACKLTSEKDPADLDALAAACAEVGRFDDAVRAAKKAVQLAPDGPAARLYRERLAACEKHTPLRASEKRGK